MQASDNAQSVEVDVEALVGLAVEHWRLAASLAAMPGGGPAAMRHAARKIGDFLARLDIQALSLDGQRFDPGMAARVIDAVQDPLAQPGSVTVLETLAPQVLWRGRVVRPAEVVTRAGPPRP